MNQKRFNVIEGVNNPFDVARNLTEGEVATILRETGWKIFAERQIGLTLYELTVVRPWTTYGSAA